jgi:NAD(P)-dependent dehydrogenase (short-subunit alcohol dehydrogenase family)
MATKVVRDKPWYSYITIDLIAHVLSTSIFHPFVAWLIPICFRAVQAPYDNPQFIGACVYASFITLIWILSGIHKRIAYGLPREVDWNDEVVVITGGANGLGKVIAETYAMRGASVAILDVVQPAKESEISGDVRFYRCDVGDAEAVERAAKAIESDVGRCAPNHNEYLQLMSVSQLGMPTICINNAGIVNGKTLWELTAKDVQRNFNVNLISHFNTIRTFLPGMLASETGGTIVTIASVLGKLGAANLSDYCAAKAGQIAMHTSLRAELSSPSAPAGAEKIRTILVTPGQLSTQLFAALETPSNFFGPVVETVELASAIVRMIDSGESGEIGMPLYTRWIEWNFVLPAGLQRVIRFVSGIDRAMGKAQDRAGKKNA